MAFSVSAIVFGTEYQLSNRNPFAIVSAQGLGISGIIRRLKDKGPKQVGSTNLGYRIDNRVITLSIIMVGDTLEEVDSHRDLFTKIFSPWEEDEDAIKLRFTRDDGEIREIICHTIGGPDYPNDPTENRMGASQRAVVQLECLEPLFYNPIQQNVTFAQSSIGGFLIPKVISWASQGASFNEDSIIAYAGSFREFPIIQIVGPLIDCVITNNTTGEIISFEGHTIADGKTYTVDLRQNVKTIEDELGNSVLQYLTADSHLTSFHLEPAPKAADGINSLSVRGSGVSANTRIYFSYFERFLSL